MPAAHTAAVEAVLQHGLAPRAHLDKEVARGGVINEEVFGLLDAATQRTVRTAIARGARVARVLWYYHAEGARQLLLEHLDVAGGGASASGARGDQGIGLHFDSMWEKGDDGEGNVTFEAAVLEGAK